MAGILDIGTERFSHSESPRQPDALHQVSAQSDFSKFYRRHSDLVSKFNVGLKFLLQQGLSEPEFYGDLVFKFRKIYACNNFSTQFRKIIIQYKKIGYNINVIRQTACMVVNPITVNNFASLLIARRRVRP